MGIFVILIKFLQSISTFHRYEMCKVTQFSYLLKASKKVWKFILIISTPFMFHPQRDILEKVQDGMKI